MPWARFDDRYPSNRKIRRLSDRAFRVDVTAICWSAGQLTDGHIDSLTVLEGCVSPSRAVQQLVREGRWHLPGHDCPSEYCYPIESGWLIHDWQEYNKPREQVKREQKARRERQERWRKKTRNDASTRSWGDSSRDALVDALEDIAPARPAPKEGGAEPRSGPPAGQHPSGPAGGPTRTPPPLNGVLRDMPEADHDVNERGRAAARAALQRHPEEAS